jgi:transcriptional repressor NrdR
MVCIYCGGKTKVTNSRPQKRLHQVWRRRCCVQCQAIFTTNEAADFSTSLIVRHSDGAVTPFSRDVLFISIHQVVGHRETPVDDASALTATITAKLLHGGSEAVIRPSEIAKAAYRTLERFDEAASVQYRAYHRSHLA